MVARKTLSIQVPTSIVQAFMSSLILYLIHISFPKFGNAGEFAYFG